MFFKYDLSSFEKLTNSCVCCFCCLNFQIKYKYAQTFFIDADKN